MNMPKDNHRIPEFPAHDDLLQDPYSRPTAPNYTNMPYAPYFQAPKKRKFVAGLLSLLVPGTGHFYLGLMQRGLFIMLLLILDIFTITTLVSQDRQEHVVSVPMVTLFALFLPVIYFYNVFDALQATDNVNRRNEFGEFANGAEGSFTQDPLQKLFRGSNLGVMLITIGVLFFLLSSKPRWFAGLFDLMGSYIGSVVLIVAGLAMFLLETRKNKSE
ncbi:DUF6677 family protein [Paenibacillus sp. GCM10027628]|uniref:DUF6677 family protein n=1 Tax=Paenibacillus sp. GCM10027628 TaxID=3273413 RepID=UPI00364342E0